MIIKRFASAIAFVWPCGLLAMAGPVAGSPSISAVNTALVESVRATRQSPPRAARSMAMVNAAVYDAVNAASGLRYRSYNYSGKAVWGLSPDAAAIVAGYRMLEMLYPTRASLLAHEKTAKLSALGIGPSGLARSIGFGASIADGLYAARVSDGSETAQSIYTFGSGPGAYQQTSATAQPQLPGWGNVTPFVMSSGSQFRVGPPPTLFSQAFHEAFIEVRDLGCVGCGTVEQNEIARFWEDGAGTFTPAGHWLQIANDFTVSARLETMPAARLMASVGAGLADAAISSWDSKYHYNYWRPQTAIAGCTLATCGVEGLSGWVSKAAANTPSYISGNGTFAGAASEAITSFFGSSAMPFCSGADPLAVDLSTRCFDSVGTAAVEGTYSRTLAGIHYRFDNEAAFATGKSIGRLAYGLFNAQGAVPEPGTWALMVAGFGFVGSSIRRRRQLQR